MSELPHSIIIVFPNYKMNPRLCGNSRGSAFLKRQDQRQVKSDASRLCMDAFANAGTYGSEFVTNGFKYTVPQSLPLKVICRRYYSGHSNLMDKENCLMGFKYYIDGIALVTGFDDRDFDLSIEQIRVKGEHRLEIELIPAWALKEMGAA